MSSATHAQATRITARPGSATEAATRGRRPRQRRGGQIGIHVLLVVMAVLVLLPFLWMLRGSFKTYDDLINRPSLPPSPFTMANYKEIFEQAYFGSAFINSTIVAVARVLCACVTSVVLGYVFAKYRFRGKGGVFVLLLSTMLIPFPAILVPLYLTLSELNLLNHISGLIVISVFSAFGTFLLRQWISGISDSYIEAARMDGASEWWIIWRVIVPLSRTPLAALAIFTFLGSWDDYLFPNVILTDPAVRTLPLALAGLKSLFWERYEIYCAGAMITVVPVMILYGFMQRHFVRGLTMGGTKE